MRNYNYRITKEKREQIRLARAYSKYSYNPRGPERKTLEDGTTYYVKGHPDNRKPFCKKQARRTVRRAKLESINSGASYKKHYPLNRMWF